MKQTKFNVVIGILAFLMVILLGGTVVYAQPKTITMKWAQFVAPTHSTYVYLEKVKEAVERRGGGQIKVEMFPGGSLVDGRGMLDAGRAGLADVVFPMPSYYPSAFPLGFYAYQVPFGVTLDTAFAVLDEARPLIEEECAANGLKYLESCPISHEWYFNRSINLDVPDWKGLKVRAMGGLLEVMAKELGAGLVSLSSSEATVALSTKVIDGLATSVSSYYHAGIYKAAPYVFVTNGMVAMLNIYAFNMDRWKTLPKNVQDIISEEFKRVRNEFFLDYVKKEEGECLKMAEKGGSVIMIPNPAQRKIWQQKMTSTWEVLPKKAGAKGQQYLDILKKHMK